MGHRWDASETQQPMFRCGCAKATIVIPLTCIHHSNVMDAPAWADFVGVNRDKVAADVSARTRRQDSFASRSG